jgi:hypothetical protein
MVNANNQVDGFKAKVDEEYRLLMPYGGERRLLVRLEVTHDASLYLFDGPVKSMHYGSVSIGGGTTSATVDITKGDVLDDPIALKSEHLSFHGSGVVKGPAGRRGTSLPLRSLTQGGQICCLGFRHLSKLPIVTEDRVRKTDVTVTYPVDEACPLAIGITAAPRSGVPLRTVPGTTFQWFYAFVYEGLLANDDLLLLLHFYNRPGTWPISNITFYPTNVGQSKTTRDGQ